MPLEFEVCSWLQGQWDGAVIVTGAFKSVVMILVSLSDFRKKLTEMFRWFHNASDGFNKLFWKLMD